MPNILQFGYFHETPKYYIGLVCVVEVLPYRERLMVYRLGNTHRKNTASLLPRCERLMLAPRRAIMLLSALD